MRNRADMFRKRRSKKNIILNSLIILVFALILIVGANLIFGGNDTAKDGETNDASDSDPNKEEMKITEDENNEQQSEAKGSKQEESSNQDEDESSEQNEDAIDQLEVEEGDDTERDENSSTAQENQDDNQSQQDDSGPNESQIGKPIGTSQTGEHTSSYERGTVDWNEKVKAIKMATGLDDSMTLWRLENGGGPHKSVGKVSPDGVQDWMYVVNLQWVDQKGWKVTSVERKSR
ncbi:DUF1510 family protein [Virgibacillus kekensis]|uniref:DUF1510 family protein n=1 Tax=Virgibacillus kekensis TaxID=202261 RepID=A0ABV9DGP2_9BACI